MQYLGFRNLETRSLNQDPLEKLFRNVRSLCGDNTRPTQMEFLGAYKVCQIRTEQIVKMTVLLAFAIY
jgi:hypothetical protein